MGNVVFDPINHSACRDAHGAPMGHAEFVQRRWRHTEDRASRYRQLLELSEQETAQLRSRLARIKVLAEV